MAYDFRIWGDDRARPRLYHATLCLGRDPDAVYVLGENDGSVLLEAWHADTGVRVSGWAVARGARLVPGELARGAHDDEVFVAVYGMARTEVVAVDLETGAVGHRLTLPRDTARVLGVARDGAAAIVSDEGGWARRVTPDRTTSLGLAVGAVASHAPWTALASPDGVRVVAADGVEVVLSSASADPTPSHIAFSPNDATLWVAGDGDVSCWDVSTRVLLGRWRAIADGAFLAFSPDGLRAMLDGPLALAVGHDRPVDPRATPWDAVHARVSPDGRRIAASSAVLSWHDLTTDRRVELAGVGHTGAIRDLAVSGDGAHVASCAADGSIRVWEAAEGASAWVFEGSPGGYDAVAFAPDGRTLYAIATTPRRLTAWSLTDGVEVTPRELPFPGEGLRVSADGRTLVARSNPRRGDPAGCLVDLTHFRSMGPWLRDALARTTLDPRSALSFGLSREGAALEVVSLAPASRALTYELASGSLLAEVEDPIRDATRGVAFSPDGRWIIGVQTDTPGAIDVTFRDVRNAYERRASRRLPGRWSLGALVAGDARAALGEADGWVTLVEREGGRQTLLPQLRSQATAMAFSPDERALYVGTHHGQVAVFRV